VAWSNGRNVSPDSIVFDPRIDNIDTNTDSVYTVFRNKNEIRSSNNSTYTRYSMIKCEYGDTIGYRTTDLVYAGDLISNVGESVTSMLDKIVSMLGGFEYFYNLDGQFVFQRKKTDFIQETLTNLVKVNGKETYAESAAETKTYAYSFNNARLVT